MAFGRARRAMAARKNARIAAAHFVKAGRAARRLATARARVRAHVAKGVRAAARARSLG
jgi:hypothetical protein